MALFSPCKLILAALAFTRVATKEPSSGVHPNALEREAGSSVDAASVQLSEAGYAQVAASGDKGAMQTFVRRVLEHEGFTVQDEGRLQGIIAFYDGECSVQSFDALITDLNKGLVKTNCSEPWLTYANQSYENQTGPSSHFLGTNNAAASAKGWLSRFFHDKHDDIIEDDEEEASATFGGLTVGSFAGFSEEGYRAVTACGDKSQVSLYVERLLEREGLRVTDQGAFQGMLRYYNGECDTQSYAALVSELHNVLHRPESCFGGPFLELENVSDGKA